MLGVDVLLRRSSGAQAVARTVRRPRPDRLARPGLGPVKRTLAWSVHPSAAEASSRCAARSKKRRPESRDSDRARLAEAAGQYLLKNEARRGPARRAKFRVPGARIDEASELFQAEADQPAVFGAAGEPQVVRTVEEIEASVAQSLVDRVGRLHAEALPPTVATTLAHPAHRGRLFRRSVAGSTQPAAIEAGRDRDGRRRVSTVGRPLCPSVHRTPAANCCSVAGGTVPPVSSVTGPCCQTMTSTSGVESSCAWAPPMVVVVRRPFGSFASCCVRAPVGPVAPLDSTSTTEPKPRP